MAFFIFWEVSSDTELPCVLLDQNYCQENVPGASL